MKSSLLKGLNISDSTVTMISSLKLIMAVHPVLQTDDRRRDNDEKIVGPNKIKRVYDLQIC